MRDDAVLGRALPLDRGLGPRNDQTCLQWSHQTTMYAACMTQRQNAGLWPTNFPCPVLDLRLTGDHFLCR